MAIHDATGSITQSKEDIAGSLSGTSSKIDSIVGGVDVHPMSIGTNFAGMASDKLPEFDAAIEKYKEAVKGYTYENWDWDTFDGFSGEVYNTAHHFYGCIINLILDYVAVIDENKRLIKEANQNWLTSAGAVSKEISRDSDEIRSAAGGLPSLD